jgi:hypothetical protein
MKNNVQGFVISGGWFGTSRPPAGLPHLKFEMWANRAYSELGRIYPPVRQGQYQFEQVDSSCCKSDNV